MYLPFGENLTNETGGFSSSMCIHVYTYTPHVKFSSEFLKTYQLRSSDTVLMRCPRYDCGEERERGGVDDGGMG